MTAAPHQLNPRPMAMRVRSCRRRDPALYSLPKIGCMTDLSPQNPKQESTYELYTRGVELLERGDYAAAAVPLRKVASREPGKSSVREALGRALFRSRHFDEAAAEFEAVVERYPTNDFAHFCLGRALDLSGEADGARRHLAIAANLRPEREDYRVYRQRLRTS